MAILRQIPGTSDLNDAGIQLMDRLKEADRIRDLAAIEKYNNKMKLQARKDVAIAQRSWDY